MVLRTHALITGLLAGAAAAAVPAAGAFPGVRGSVPSDSWQGGGQRWRKAQGWQSSAAAALVSGPDAAGWLGARPVAAEASAEERPAARDGAADEEPQGSNLEVVRPLPPDAVQHKLDGDRRITQVRLGDLEVPLKDPVASCEAAQSADGKLAVLLAGGVRTSLDVYLVDRESGAFYVFRTFGGRRLPATFDGNGGQGSWPSLEGKALVLLCYEKDARVQLRAIDFEGRIHASRELPLSTQRFHAASDEYQVRVSFPDEPPLLFPHPLAPRLELQSGMVAFGPVVLGERAERRLVLHNTGRRLLALRLELAPGAFALPAGGTWTVPPSGRTEVPLEFRPLEVGDQHVRLTIVPRTREPQGAVVLLSGSGIDAAEAARVEAAAAIGALPQLRPAGGGPPPARVPAVAVAPAVPAAVPPAAPPAPPALNAPDPQQVWTERLGAARVAVRGQLSDEERRRLAGLPLTVEIAVGDAPAVRVPVGDDGRFLCELAAERGERVRLTLVSGEQRSSAAVLGPLLPCLEQDGGELVVRAAPEQAFLLLAVAVAADSEEAGVEPRIARTLGAWRGRAAGASGEARVPLAFLGSGSAPVHLIAVVESDGKVQRSNVLTVKPIASN